MELEFTKSLPEEFIALVLNEKKDIDAFSILKASEYLKKNELKDENLILEDNFLISSLLSSKIILEIFNDKSEVEIKNLNFVNIYFNKYKNHIESQIDDRIYSESNSDRNIIFEKIKDIQNKDERTKELNHLLEKTILNKSSYKYTVYNNFTQFIESVLPSLQKCYLEYYQDINVEEKKDLLEQNFLRVSLETKIIGDLMMYLNLSNSFKSFNLNDGDK